MARREKLDILSRYGLRSRAERAGGFSGLARALARALALGLVVGGCAASPPEPTRVVVTISASPAVNPDVAGEPSPIFVRLYELTSETPFTTATFNELYHDEQATLGDALRGKEDVSLAPGQTTTVSREFADGSGVIGVLAAFQDIDAARWRASAPVPPNTTTPVEVSIGRTDVTIQTASEE